MRKILTSLFTLLLITSNLVAAEPELTEKLINAWMKSQNALEEWGKEHQAKLETSQSPSDTKDPTDMTPASMISPLKKAGLYDSANQLVRDNGFTSINEWAAITLRITKAAAAIEIEAHPDMLNNQQLETLRDSKEITPEHKEILSAAIEQNQIMVKQILNNTSKADKAAVKPFLNRILSLMEEPY